MRSSGAMLLLFLAVPLTATQALGQSCPFENQPCLIDLKTGSYSPNCDPAIVPSTGWPFDIVTVPQLRNDLPDAFFETVLKVTFQRPGQWRCTEAHITVVYEGIPTGHSLNIGDSRSNDGHGGDYASQSNDAELWMVHAPYAGERTLNITYNDNVNAERICSLDLPLESASIQFVVKDGFISWSPPYGHARSIFLDALYALDGQPDREGPVNYDIFVAVNRVIDGFPGSCRRDRLGSGVETMIVEMK